MQGRLFAAGVIVLSIASVGVADKWAPPKPETYRKGDFEFRTEPQRGFSGPAVGVLMRVDNQDAAVLWKRDLVNLPHRVQILQDGPYVLTIDTYAHLGYDHALVLYGAQGKVLVDLKLDDFLTKADIAQHVTQTVSSRHWFNDKHTFICTDKVLAVELSWGKKFEVSLETGKLIAPNP